jgi:NADH-quinone oxidoreductase subunit J
VFVEFLFYGFATVLVAAALGVIVTRNPVHSALCLVLCFFTSAALWLLIEAEFLAIVLVLVYVGAVMVLFLFVVMMLDINVEELKRGFTRFAWLGWITAAVVIFEIVGVVTARKLGVDVTRGAAAMPPGYSNTAALGKALYTEYVYPFELAAVLLLVAIVAAISLTMRRRPGLRQQNVGAQVAVRREDRVRLVKMGYSALPGAQTEAPAEESAEGPAADAAPSEEAK